MLILAVVTCMPILAQRTTDILDRGLVAVAMKSGVFCSWRILAEEYYDVTYNIYRDGVKLNDTPLEVSNYTDASGTSSNTYTVSAIVNSVEQSQCTAVTPWNTGRVDTSSKVLFPCPAYKAIQVADVYDRNGTCVWKNEDGTITSTANYTINDISLGDVDGDGQIDFIVKRKNQTDQDSYFPTDNTTAFCRIEVYASSADYGLLWYIDCGPNTVYGADEQWDAVAFDWDQDGRCEVLYRAYANTIIHKADGSTVTIGSENENIRPYITHSANYTFSNCGNEYLVYMDGKTGTPYVTMEYPLKRLETSEFSTEIDWDSPSGTEVSSYLEAVNTAWGDSYGHRSSKYFMGAPYLDGRTPSIYLGRGIYTQEKMIAYDVDPSTHALTQKWTWSNSTSGSAWYGQGYHNFAIADVDEDGRDEIVYGSMVIDDNGQGLSTTGLGHGDASHTGDLDPFRQGLETFACNEDNPSNNYRNSTTSEIYYRLTGSSDDGRSMAGNFSDEYPGSWGASASSGIIALSATTPTAISGITNNWNQNSPNPIALNFRLYWDGDLCEETFNGPGSSEGEMFVDKLGTRVIQTSGCANINGTKKNPCALGDIIGDWREELVLRSSDNTEFRIYTTTDETEYRIPALWYDHEYRQAMVWQTEGYNQPPHTSFFLGKLEDITAAPPALTNTGKTEIAADATITTDQNDKDLLITVEPSKATNNRYAVYYSGKIAPHSLTINVPTIVSGNDDNSNITSQTYTCLLNNSDGSSGFSGAMRLVKQGNGILSLATKTLGHTGQTDVWGGTLNFSGTFSSSKVWMNRHTTLNTTSGTFNGGIEMNYNSTLAVTTAVTVSDLTLNYGSRVVLNVASTTDNTQNSQLNISGTLTIGKKEWSYGPEYSTPVLEVSSSSALELGDYPIGSLSTVSGDLEDIVIEGSFSPGSKQKLYESDGTLYLKVYDDEEYIGSRDNTTAWWNDFSDSYTIKSGYKYNFKFKNYSSGTENYHDWVLVTTNGTGHSTSDRSDYAEYFVLRADQYGWGNYYNAPTLTLVDGTLDWSTFKTDMAAGADVDMELTFQNSIVSVDATITSATGNVYTYTFASKEISADEITAFFTVDYSHMTYPEIDETEIEPTNTVTGTSTTYDFTTTSTGSGIVYLTSASDYKNVGQSDWSYNSVYTTEVGTGIAFTRLASSSKMYGFCYRYGGLLCLSQSHTLTLVGLEAGTEVTVTTSANAISNAYQGSYGGTWVSSTNDDATTTTYTITSDGDLNLQIAAGAYIYTITVAEPVSLTLEPKAVDDYTAGIYQLVTVNRSFNAGYSTLCVPINTTVSEFTGGDEEAHAYYLSDTSINTDGTYTLTFTKTDNIKANKPYIIYLSKALSAPAFTSQAVFAEEPKTVTCGNWSMTGNYTVGKSMAGLYGVAKNASIMKGGANSTLNGMTAFLTGPSNANAKISFWNTDIEDTPTLILQAETDEASTIEAIYSIDGRRQNDLSKGINIVRMSNGAIRKINVKQ